MATRIKASASAMRRRIKRRSERASHKKKTNATLRSRKQRARKTARVMRGGGLKPYYLNYYVDISGETINFDRKPNPILRLDFSKNMIGNSYTLTLEFVIDELAFFKSELLIPHIINGLLVYLFDYNLKGTENTPPDFDFANLNLESLATLEYAIDIEIENQKYNRNVFFKKSIKNKEGKFEKPCVITLEFEPKGEETIVRLKSYTTLVYKGFDENANGKFYYYGWDTQKLSYSFDVKKPFNADKVQSLNQNSELYVCKNNLNNKKDIFSFDKDKISKQIQDIILKINKRVADNRKWFEDQEKANQEAIAKEEQRRAGLTEEQRKAEDAANAIRALKNEEYLDRLNRW